MPDKNYSIDEHIHRYGVWTAARGASRGRLKNTEVEDLFNRAGLRESVETLTKNKSLDQAAYRVWIKDTGTKMCRLIPKMNLTQYKSEYFSFGVAAKLISLYIKTVIILPTKGKSVLSQVAYPPIDRILLKSVNKDKVLRLPTTWSKFDWKQYMAVIDKLDEIYPSEPKWKIEVNWKLANEEDSTTRSESVRKKAVPSKA